MKIADKIKPAQFETVMVNVVPAVKRLVRRRRSRVTITVLMPAKRTPPIVWA